MASNEWKVRTLSAERVGIGLELIPESCAASNITAISLPNPQRPDKSNRCKSKQYPQSCRVATRQVDRPPHQRLQDAGAEEGAGVGDARGHAGEGVGVHFFHAGPAEGEAGGAEAHEEEEEEQHSL